MDKRGKKIILAAKWVDNELIDNLKIRSRLNRNWRYAKENNLPMEIQEECRKKYMHQKTKTAVMAGEKKSTWEKEKVEEMWRDGKKFWAMIRELIGKDREREEEAYVYDSEGKKDEIMNIKKDFTTSWWENIYQKSEKNRLLFLVWKGRSDGKNGEGSRPPTVKHNETSHNRRD